jgi:hypothetical protein
LNRHTASLFIGSETDCCRLTATPTSPWQTFADLLDPPENLYASDPVGYVRDVMGEHLWSGQVKMLDAIMKHRKVAVKAAHSVGKTRALSRLVVAWVMTHPIDSTRVIITSDNDDNIKGGIWQEVIAAHEAAEAAGKPFPGKPTLDSKWHAGPNNQTLVAQGRKPSDRNPTGLHGFHKKYLLVIIDEATGLPEELWDAAESLASNENGRVLACGNPTDPNSHFAEVCKPGSGWEVQKISAYDTPVYTGEPCPTDVLENLVHPSWVEDMKRKGINDPRYVSRVLGEFPKVSSDALIEAEWIEAAQKRSLQRTRRPHLGIDIARFGDDETVIMQREGSWARVAWAGGKLSTMESAGHIIRVKNQLNSEPGLNDFVTMAVDADGLGAGVFDRLIELGYSVGEIRGGMRSTEPDDYVDLRAEWYWKLRERFERGDIDIDPYDKELAKQLVKIKWSLTSRGQVKIESKKEMRARGLPSPDRADALAYAFAQIEITGIDVESHRGESITGDLMTKAW